MSSSRPVAPKAVSEETPPVPLTIEGYSVLHQMMRIRWTSWRQLPSPEKKAIVDEASSLLARMEANAAGQSALFSLLGHKGDLMLVHFRGSFDELNQAELQLAQLGLYESTIKAYKDLKDRGIAPHSEEWKREISDVLVRQKEAMHPRLFPELPKHRYLSFYPMDRRRGEARNWYTLPIEERARQ